MQGSVLNRLRSNSRTPSLLLQGRAELLVELCAVVLEEKGVFAAAAVFVRPAMRFRWPVLAHARLDCSVDVVTSVPHSDAGPALLGGAAAAPVPLPVDLFLAVRGYDSAMPEDNDDIF